MPRTEITVDLLRRFQLPPTGFVQLFRVLEDLQLFHARTLPSSHIIRRTYLTPHPKITDNVQLLILVLSGYTVRDMWAEIAATVTGHQTCFHPGCQSQPRPRTRALQRNKRPDTQRSKSVVFPTSSPKHCKGRLSCLE